MKPMPGDTVEYTRRSDGTTVRGDVMDVHARDLVPHLFHSQLAEEDVAYRLVLSAEDAARIGHPVTIGHSRLNGVGSLL